MSRANSGIESRMVCPCGGPAYTLTELLALDPNTDERAWDSILGPNDHYCSNEDDVLLPGEATPRKAA